MKQSKLILICLCLCALTGAAQTNDSLVRPLSLKDCIQIALEHNLGLKIERYNPEIARFNLGLAYSDYEPVFSGAGTHQRDFTAAESGLSNTVGTTVNSDSIVSGISGKLPTGASYDLSGDISNARSTDSSGSSVNSQGSASLQLQQPLLKDFWIDASRLEIQVDKRLLKISELGLRQQIMDTITSVELAYYDLKLAQQNVKVQEQALKLAEELQAANQQRVEQGVLAPSDEKQTESQVASQRALLLVAQQSLAAQQNVLKRLLSDKIAEWQDIIVEPTDDISAPQQVLSRQESWRKGLTMRPDLLQTKLDLERLGYILKFNYNQLFPQLDLVGSYGYSGSDRVFGGVFEDIRRRNSPSYAVGVAVTIPLGNSSARNKYKISKAEQQQGLLNLQRLEQDVMLQIEDAVKLAQTNFGRVSATKAAREFAEAALDAEQTKFENGLSTSFFVLQLQRDLTSARSAEIQALVDYNKSLAQLALSEGSVLERNNVFVASR